MRYFLVILTIATVLTIQYAEVYAKKGIFKNRLLRGRLGDGLVLKIDRPTNLERSIPDQFFVQQLDHFDDSNNSTWLQRFWFSDKWYRPGGPQFLYIGGEGEESSYSIEIESSQWITLAKEVGAVVYVLEHRFYGSSQPTGDLTVESLKYLTSEQALADINSFILAQNKLLNLTNPRWITFGGSYSGALSAWVRQKYPDTVYAAVGASGPVQAIVDFTGYMEVVYKALYSHNPKCAESVYEGFSMMSSLMANDSNALTDYFHLCDELDTSNKTSIYSFYYSILENYMGIVQYSEVMSGYYANIKTIPELCHYQLSGNNGFDGVVFVNWWLMVFDFDSCVNVDYWSMITVLQNTDVDSEVSGTRSWYWQTCNEFGYYQSTDSDLVEKQFSGPRVPVEFDIQQCEDIFGSVFSNKTIYENIDKTNSYYYGQNGYNGTRVVLTNGSNDPWHVLGVLKPTNNEVYRHIIAGTSHCADMARASKDDKPGLKAARQATRSLVLKWSKA